MPMYNSIEYSDNYFKRSGSLWQCYRNEPLIGNIDNIFDVPVILLVLHLNIKNKKVNRK